MLLDLGCGSAKWPGAVGIDIFQKSQADIIADLSCCFPLKNNCADEIICQDIVEHIDRLDTFFREIIRISRNKAIVRIRTPHYTSRYAYHDFTHLHYFGIRVFDLLKEKMDGEKYSIRIMKRTLLFPKLWRMTGIAWLMNKFPDRYEQHFCYVFPAENMYFEIEILKARIKTELP